jgi:hypothetical protein
MANFYWSVNVGQHKTDVVMGSTDPGTTVDVVLRINNSDAQSGLLTRQALLTLLKALIVPVIMEGTWPAL